MTKFTLSKDQLQDLIDENKYSVDPDKKFLSRCIDGRYENESGLPALAMPGGDAGELALLFATANTYGFSVKNEDAYKILTEIIGGEKNLGIHTDEHVSIQIQNSKLKIKNYNSKVKNDELVNSVLMGCGHIKQIGLDLEAYKLTNEQLTFIKTVTAQAVKKGAKQTSLRGEHMESAVVIIKGNWGIYPRYTFDTSSGNTLTEIFIYHASLANERRKLFAEKLLKQKAVELFDGLDADYLYQALSDVGENHLMETAKRLASGLSLYEVTFGNQGEQKIEEMGKV
ncbi:hypothetical protein COT62_03415 [Candidatus Roizmanbacteria bacterium CG09_land_8_20_14_0_10_41_9]|uniref:Uncharacterized protein n=1 Tax=Candidatus Roizmanbacteria bacterium CG09_land_8_20_14_0_10_41_9 TaxID=1974850 RepID=A0A2H0WS89_9BACT|nr:MAG: hypothetical protein COT62_03415 [Candidatus Roizmanbacteria bacterium CG09_land_8_20_14_0_10_41_9]